METKKTTARTIRKGHTMLYRESWVDVVNVESTDYGVTILTLRSQYTAQQGHTETLALGDDEQVTRITY